MFVRLFKGLVMAPPERPTHVAEDEWEGLSDSEREALTETDEGEGAHQIIGDEEGTIYPPYGDEEELDEAALATIAGGEPPKVETPKAETPPTETPTPETPSAETPSAPTVEPSYEDILGFRPVVTDSEVPLPATVPAELQGKLDALDTKADDLDAQFEAGDITRADLRKEEREIQRERDAINRDILQYQITERDVAREDLLWKKEQAQFVNTYASDYKQVAEDGKTLSDRSIALFSVLQGQVNRLIKDPAWQDKPGMAILVEADKRVLKALGMAERGKGRPATPAAATPAAETKPSATERNTPPNLAEVPIAEQEQVGNQYSALTRLSGEKFEKALERMTPEQRERMLEGM